MTIIERDIAFYTQEIERARAELQRCLPAHEAIWQMRKDRAVNVVASLKAYNTELKRFMSEAHLPV